MSFLNAPDARTLGRVAGALAVDEAFVEKDWYVVRAIAVLLALDHPGITPVFSGGTALLKAHGLIKRFSEDIDFKLILSEEIEALTTGQRRKALSDFKAALADAWQEAGFELLTVEAGSGNAFIKVEMKYPSVLDPHGSLRPHILAELSAKPPRLAPQNLGLSSFVAQYRGIDPEVSKILCVDPVETAADKLSAFAWRAVVRERGAEGDDGTIIRHVHDLAALEPSIAERPDFASLLLETVLADSNRGGGALADLAPAARLAAMHAKLDADPAYRDDYEQFVESLAFAGEGEVPGYDAAIDALRRLSALLAVPVTTVT